MVISLVVTNRLSAWNQSLRHTTGKYFSTSLIDGILLSFLSSSVMISLNRARLTGTCVVLWCSVHSQRHVGQCSVQRSVSGTDTTREQSTTV
jgi:hypothetical protein